MNTLKVKPSTENQQAAEMPQRVDEIKNMEQALQTQISKMSAIHEKITLRDKFINLKRNLSILKENAASDDQNIFDESDSVSIQFYKSVRYNEQSILSIKNLSLIDEVISFIMKIIEEKIKTLEIEILA